MKKDKLQNRTLFRVQYEFKPGQFEYISVGADKDSFFVIRRLAYAILTKKYFDRVVNMGDIRVL